MRRVLRDGLEIGLDQLDAAGPHFLDHCRKAFHGRPQFGERRVLVVDRCREVRELQDLQFQFVDARVDELELIEHRSVERDRDVRRQPEEQFVAVQSVLKIAFERAELVLLLSQTSGELQHVGRDDAGTKLVEETTHGEAILGVFVERQQLFLLGRRHRFGHLPAQNATPRQVIELGSQRGGELNSLR